MHDYLFTDQFESELVSTFTAHYIGAINFDAEEIDEIRYWDILNSIQKLGTSVFAGHFEKEISTYLNDKKLSGHLFI